MTRLLLSADSTRCWLGRRAWPLRNHRTPAPLWEVWQVRVTELAFSTRFRLGDTTLGLVSISGNTQRETGWGVRDPFSVSCPGGRHRAFQQYACMCCGWCVCVLCLWLHCMGGMSVCCVTIMHGIGFVCMVSVWCMDVCV